jgi:hypothetical protein
MGTKIIISTLFIITFGWLLGQNTLPERYDTSVYKQEFILQSKYDLFSTSLPNYFTNQLIFGGGISTQETKTLVENSHFTNTIGLEANSELEYRNLAIFPTKKWGLVFKTSINTINSCHYTKDMLGLILQGNSAYLGKAIQLNPSSLQSISYYKFGIGFIHKTSKNNFSINVYSIKNYINSMLSYGALYVSDSSSLALLDVSGNSTSYYASGNSQNVGIGLDFDLKIPVTTFTDSKIFIQITAKNFGVGILTKEVHYYAADTNYQFQGFSLQTIENLAHSSKTNEQQLQALTIYNSTKKRYIPLYGYIQIHKVNPIYSSQQIQSIFGARIYPSISYLPYLYAGIQLKIGKKSVLGIYENYGITNQFRTGMYLETRFSGFNLTLGSENIIGSFRSQGYGRSVQCKISYRL